MITKNFSNNLSYRCKYFSPYVIRKTFGRVYSQHDLFELQFRMKIQYINISNN